MKLSVNECNAQTELPRVKSVMSL